MPTITELPNDTGGEGLPDSDHQLQPMDYEHTNTGSPANSTTLRDAGRVSFKVK